MRPSSTRSGAWPTRVETSGAPAASDSRAAFGPPSCREVTTYDVEGVVCASELRSGACVHVEVRDARTLEPLADEPACGAREQDEQLRNGITKRPSAARSTSGPFISFGSSPRPSRPRPSGTSPRRTPTAAARAGRVPAPEPRRRPAENAPDRCPAGSCARARSTPAPSTNSRISACVTWMRAMRSGLPAQRVERVVELRRAVGARAAVHVGQAEPMGRPEPAGGERVEVARQEDGLADRRTEPSPAAPSAARGVPLPP